MAKQSKLAKELTALDEVIHNLNKQFKSNIINEGLKFEKITRIPFSSPRLNYMTYGGLPVGRIVEFSGEEGGGKTSTALDIAGNAQRLFPNKKVLLVDIERTLDAEWATKLNVDVEKLVVFSPDEQTAEQVFESIKRIVETGEVSVCVIDSLGAMVSAQAYSKTIEEKTYGGISTALTLFSKEMIPICARTGCLLIGINQVREDMNSMYGGTVTTGGRAWRHNCSVRMQFTKSDFINDRGESVTRSVENPAGHYVKVALIKSKVCKLNRKIGYYLLKYLDGIDIYNDVVEIGIKNGEIIQAGAWYSVVDKETGEIRKSKNKELLKFQGKTKLVTFLSSINYNDYITLSYD